MTCSRDIVQCVEHLEAACIQIRARPAGIVKLAKTRSTQVERVGGHVDEAGGARGHEHREHLWSPFREPLKAAKSQGGAALLSPGNRRASPPTASYVQRAQWVYSGSRHPELSPPAFE